MGITARIDTEPREGLTGSLQSRRGTRWGPAAWFAHGIKLLRRQAHTRGHALLLAEPSASADGPRDRRFHRLWRLFPREAAAELCVRGGRVANHSGLRGSG